MKLKDVTHYDDWFKETIPFNFHTNRFELFDRDGYELNSYFMQEVPSVLDIDVLDITESSYNGYGVGFKTTHIKLNCKTDSKWVNPKFRFGDADTRG